MSIVLEKFKAPKVKTADGLPIHRLTVETYEKMIEHGIFGEDDRVELLNGVIVEMSPKKTKHTIVTYLVNGFFQENLRLKAIIRTQEPIRLDDLSEPEPDVVLVKSPLSKYFKTHPTPSDVLLVVEISDTTLLKDRQKTKNYARAGIAQYLLFNLNADEIEDYREPGADGYRFKRTYTVADSFALLAFPEIEIKTRDLFPDE